MPRALLLLLAYFPLMSVLSVCAASFLTYIHIRDRLQEPMIDRLERVAALKEADLRRWFENERDQVLAEAQSPELVAIASQVIEGRGRQGAPEAHAVLEAYIETSPLRDTSEPVISILTTGGIIVFSTSPGREGQYQSLQNTSTYFTADRADRIEPNFYRSPISGELMITLATPIEAASGGRVGALAVDLDLAALDQLIRSSVDFGEDGTYLGLTGQTYLVGRTSLVETNFIAPDPTGRHSSGISSRGISNAVSGSSGIGLYLNYNRVPVLGAYRWLGGINLALLAEVEQSEIFLPARIASRRVFMMGLGVVIVLNISLLAARRTIPGQLTTVHTS